MYQNDVIGAALDRHITGNWGWDYDKGVIFERGYEDCCEDCCFCATIVDENGRSFDCVNDGECEYEDNAADFAEQERADSLYDAWVDRKMEGR